MDHCFFSFSQRSLCRVSLFVAHGIGEPGVAWATVFITRLALSGHESYMSRRKRLKRELLGWLGPNVVYQALIASIASTDVRVDAEPEKKCTF